MATRGRKQKPKIVKLAEGTFEPTRHTEPKHFKAGWPPNPFKEGTIAHDQFNLTCDNLEYMGVLSEFDGSHIEAYAESYEIMKRSYEILEQDGFVAEDARGRKSSNPVFRIWSAAADKVRSLGNDLGTNYAARVKLAQAQPEPKDTTEAKKASYFG